MARQYQYHYVYRISNVIEKKYYYGKRSTNCIPKKELGIKYFSSSTDKTFITDQKENPHNYSYKIIKIYNDKQKALCLEIKLHNYFNVGKNPHFYNKAKQTSVGFDITGIPIGLGIPCEEGKKQKISASLKGHIPWNKGKQHSSKTIQKLKEKAKQRIKSPEKIKMQYEKRRQTMSMKSPEEKQAIYQKISQTMSMKSPEEKQAIYQKVSQTKNMKSPEEKHQKYEKRRQTMALKSPEELQAIYKKMGNLGKAKIIKISTPDGIFPSIAEAATYYDVCIETIRNRCKSTSEKMKLWFQIKN